MDPPYVGGFSSKAPGVKPVTVTQLAALNLPQLCPIGFIFIWVDKSVLSDVVYLMERYHPLASIPISIPLTL